jgi:hypothetical protein
LRFDDTARRPAKHVGLVGTDFVWRGTEMSIAEDAEPVLTAHVPAKW